MANLGALAKLLKSQLIGLGADVERGVVHTPRYSKAVAGTIDELNWDKGSRAGTLMRTLDKLKLTPEEAAQSGNMHTHVPWRQEGYSDHWLAAPPSEGDYRFADRFLNGAGENYVLHPTSGVVEQYGIKPEGKRTLIDLARKADPAFNYQPDETGLAAANLIAPGVYNPKFKGTLPPEFANDTELSRRLNGLLLKEHGATLFENDGPQYDNNLMEELLQQYKKQPRKFVKGGLVQYKDCGCQ